MLRTSLLLALALAVAGCDSQDSLLGEFVGTTEIGADVRAVEGEAVYTVVEGADGPEFVIGLFVGGLYESDFDRYDYVLFRRPGARPGVGAYGIDDDPDRAFNATIARVEDADEPTEADGAVLNGFDGTLALTRIDDFGFIAGSFEFVADGVRLVPGDDDRQPSVAFEDGAARGTFEARYESPSVFRRLGLDLGI